MLIDSHCHIDGEAFDLDRDNVVERARGAGVAAMLNVGTGDPHSDDFRRAVAVAERYEGVFASVGVHPHDAKLYDDKAEGHLIELTRLSKKVIAWGEIGLDYYYDHSPREVQREVFRRQIRVAKDLGLPIIVHSRDANEDTVGVLKEEFGRSADTSVRMSAKHEVKQDRSASSGNAEALTDTVPFAAGGDADKSVRAPGIMHCFGGTARMAEDLMKIGFLISFAGNGKVLKGRLAISFCVRSRTAGSLPMQENTWFYAKLQGFFSRRRHTPGRHRLSSQGYCCL